MNRPVSWMMIVFIGTVSFLAASNAGEKIRNQAPKHGELKLDLQENVLIKETEEDPNYQFGGMLWDLAVDKDGLVYVLDLDRLLKYDSHGKFIAAIGKKGEGPGEYLQPRAIFVHEGGDVYVSDRGRTLHVFGKDGAFVKKILLDFSISFSTPNIFIDRDGRIFAASMEMSASGPRTCLVISDPNGKTIKRFGLTDDENTKFQGSSRGGVMSALIHEYSQRLCFCHVQGSTICLGNNTDYDLFLYDLAGILKTEFSKEEEPVPITAEERKSLGPSAVFPPHRPFIGGLLSDEEGRIYVLRAKSLLEKNPATKIDIFGLDGRYLYETVVPFKPRLILNGSFISIEQDENQGRLIKKWTIKNYCDIKAK
jgi:hypothetical protein